jgi:hypothetical protein
MTPSSLKKISLALDNFHALRPLLIKDVVSYEHTALEEVTVVFESTEPFKFQKEEDLELTDKIYIAIDSGGQDAFAHWVFESAIWIPEIKRQYPAFVHKMEFLLLNKKKYKEDFLEHLGVRYTYNPTQNNITIICPPYTSLNSHRYLSRYCLLIDSFHRYLEEISYFSVKTINNLLLPRQKKENLKANDRSVDTSNIEEVFNRSPTEALTYNTDESINFSVQVQTIRQARTIFVTDGSAFLVNGFIAKSSTIVVLGASLVPNQSLMYEKMAAICSLIEKNNDVVFIQNVENKFEFETIKSFCYNEIIFRKRWSCI